MPIHDWTRVDADLVHHFHHHWTGAICNSLNSGGLPAEFFALSEQRMGGPIADVLTLNLAVSGEPSSSDTSALAVKTAPPRARLVCRTDADVYSSKANRIVIRHRHGQVVAVLEVVSPGNKKSRAEARAFVQKSADLIRQGIHLLVVDLFPPGPRDPQGIAKRIWDEIQDEHLELPADQPLLQASFDAGDPRVAYFEPVAVGDTLPDMPLFLQPETYVPAPLESTYQASWNVFPTALKGLLNSSTPP